MATLTANGPVLLRISRERNIEGDLSVTWRRTTRSYHANGVILEKHDTRFRPTASFDPPEGRFHSWGWKKIVKAQSNPKPTEHAQKVLALVRKVSDTDPWTVEFVSPEISLDTVTPSQVGL